MGAGIEVGVGIKSAAFKRGLDEMRAQADKFKGDLGSNLLGAISFGAVLAGFDAMLDKFGRVQDLADRFGESAESIQRVGSAAQQSGSDIELVAKALTRLTIDANAAALGVDANVDAWKDVGINAARFRDLSMEDKLVELADAYVRCNGNSQKTVAFMELLGGRAQDLIPLLAQGGEALKAAFGEAPAVSGPTVQALDNIGDSLTRVKELSAVAFDYLAKLVALNGPLVETVVNAGKAIASGKGLEGVKDAAKQGYATAKEIVSPTETKKEGPSKAQIAAAALANAEKQSEKKAKESAAAKEVTDLAKLRKEIAEQEAKGRMDAMDDEEKLQQLYADRNALLAKANDQTVEGLTAKKQALEVDLEAQNLSEKISEKAEERGKKNAELRAKQQEGLRDALTKEAEGNEKRQFDSLKTPGEKVDFLKKKQAGVVDEANAAQQQADSLYGNDSGTEDKRTALKTKASQKRQEAGDLQSQIMGLQAGAAGEAEKKDATRPSVAASSLREVGGGGRATVSGGDKILDENKAQTKWLEKLYTALTTGDGPTRERAAATASQLQNRK